MRICGRLLRHCVRPPRHARLHGRARSAAVYGVAARAKAHCTDVHARPTRLHSQARLRGVASIHSPQTSCTTEAATAAVLTSRTGGRMIKPIAGVAFVVSVILAAQGAPAATQEPPPAAGDEALQEIVVTGNAHRPLGPRLRRRQSHRHGERGQPRQCIATHRGQHAAAAAAAHGLRRNRQRPDRHERRLRARHAQPAQPGRHRNLVLLDGRRMTPASNTFAVDVNSLPAGLIDNVEIITGGASAVYGSDAIAGVINFRLKHDFQGLQLDVRGGTAQESGYGNVEASVLGGYQSRGWPRQRGARARLHAARRGAAAGPRVLPACVSGRHRHVGVHVPAAGLLPARARRPESAERRGARCSGRCTRSHPVDFRDRLQHQRLAVHARQPGIWLQQRPCIRTSRVSRADPAASSTPATTTTSPPARWNATRHSAASSTTLNDSITALRADAVHQVQRRAALDAAQPRVVLGVTRCRATQRIPCPQRLQRCSTAGRRLARRGSTSARSTAAPARPSSRRSTPPRKPSRPSPASTAGSARAAGPGTSTAPTARAASRT